MTNEEFDALVARLERDAQRQPGAYKLKVWLLAALGNAYVGAMLLLIVATLLALAVSTIYLKALAVKLAIVVGVFLWVVLKALWVKLDPPAGAEIARRQAPQLFVMIDALRQALKAPRFHHVLLTDDFNAAVVQSPRLGIFGWPRNYLLLGLPLMKTLTVEQFRAVLAHEFGHLAKGHGRMSNWIYRQRLRWSRLLEALEANESRGSFLFKPFLQWFAPYFSAYSFPMARANEYEADATSARLTSPRAAAQALTSVNVVGSFLSERYWPKIYSQAQDQPQPGFTPYFGMGRSLVTEIDEQSAAAWLDRALAEKTSSADTHPALADRLSAIGETPCLALPAAGESADLLLGDSLATMTEGFDARWKESILPSWEQRYRSVQESRRQLNELNARAADGAGLTLQEAYDRACLTESVGGDADGALAQLTALSARAPDDPVIAFALGARLLDRDDAGGCPLIERAMQADESTIAGGCELMRDFHWRAGRKDEAQAWHRRMAERIELERAAARERDQVTLRDRFEPHRLGDEALAALRRQLGGIPGLRKAYFVRKPCKHLPHRTLYIFGYVVHGPLQIYRKKRVAEALRRVQESVAFPGETLILNVEGDNYRFGRKFRFTRGARIL